MCETNFCTDLRFKPTRYIKWLNNVKKVYNHRAAWNADAV